MSEKEEYSTHPEPEQSYYCDALVYCNTSITISKKNETHQILLTKNIINLLSVNLSMLCRQVEIKIATLSCGHGYKWEHVINYIRLQPYTAF